MTWSFVVMIGLAGFFGAGSYSLWRTEHKFGAGVIAAIALACLVMAILWFLPGSDQA